MFTPPKTTSLFQFMDSRIRTPNSPRAWPFRYLLLEFPCLTVSQPPQHFLEIGCGCGSSLLPVLKANPTCSVTGTDLSPTAVAMFKQAAAKAGIAAHRFSGHAADSTQADAGAAPLQGAATGPWMLCVVGLGQCLPLIVPQAICLQQIVSCPCQQNYTL